MPRQRRRPGTSRLLLPVALGAIAFAGVGSVVVGTVLQPTPAGALGAVQGAVWQPSGRDSIAVSAASEAPLAQPAPSSGRGALRGAVAYVDERAGASASPGPVLASELAGYQWPLRHGRITLPFGPSKWGSRMVDGEPFHDGLDLATFCADRIVAAHDGVVLAAGRHYDTKMGWVGDLEPYLDRLDARSLWSTLPIVVVVDDGNGYRSIYAHLSKTVVKKGQIVSAGDLLGYEGKTGRASGCHLHYGLFSPQETAHFGIDPGVVERMKLPAWQIARVDPLLVLPERVGAKPQASASRSPRSPGGSKPPAE